MDILSLLYVAAGFVFALAFVPQVRALLRDTTGAASISLSTWALFTLCNCITLAYAIAHNGDPYFVFCTAMCTLGNMVVFGLALVRRSQVVRVRRRR